MAVELSIIMPCLNEAETLESCIRNAQSFLERSGIQGEIVIGDNGSTDGSQDIARRCGARVTDVSFRGYGAAVQGAIASSQGKYCIMGDADDSYDFSRLDSYVAKLRFGADLVIGNRFCGGIAPGAMPWKNRYIGNPILSGIGRLLFGSPARDFHCGMRGFSRDAIVQMDLRTTGMEFASEMIIKATLLKLKIIEVPTTLKPDGRSRAPHLRPYRDGWRHLRFMLLFSPDWLFLYPGAALAMVGLGLGTLLSIHPIVIGHVRFSTDTMIYCATLIEIGFQAVLFASLSRAFVVQEGLFPKPSNASVFESLFSLERGTLFGLFLLLLGIGLFFYAVKIWSDTHFGELDVDQITRIVIGSSVFLSLGLEVIFLSCLLGVLRLNIRALPQNTTIQHS